MKKQRTEHAPGPPKRSEATMELLPVRFTDPERLSLAEQLARAIQAKGDLENQKKVTDTKHKEQLAGIDLSISSLSRKMTQGYEMEMVQSKWIFEDPTPNEKTLVRIDTGEVVRTVPMQQRDYENARPGVKEPEPDGPTLVLEPPPTNGKATDATPAVQQ